jgi:hypothetical protein
MFADLELVTREERQPEDTSRYLPAPLTDFIPSTLECYYQHGWHVITDAVLGAPTRDESSLPRVSVSLVWTLRS